MKQLVENLKEFGLTTYQAKVYLTLLRYGDLTASRIARYGDIPSNKSYEAARVLESRGFVNRSARSPYTYRAEDPRVCVDRLLASRREKNQLVRDAFVERAGGLVRKVPSEGGVWYHTMGEIARGRLRDMMRSARHELILLNANGTAHKYRRTLSELGQRVCVHVRKVEGDTDILIIDRERTYLLPHQQGGIEVAFPSVAATLAGLTAGAMS